MKSVLIAGAMAFLAVDAGAADAPRLLAHRGGMMEFDENSLGAFRACYEKGLRGFETDIRLTKDDVLVILHDDKLERTSTGKGPVENLTANAVKSLRLKKSGEPVPLARDLLNYFKDKPDISIELEMKTGNTDLYTPARLETYCRLLHDAVQATMPAGTYCFTSFDQRALRIMKKLYPDANTGLIVGGALDDKQIELALELGAKRIAPMMDVTSRKAVRDAHKAGLRVTGWPTLSEADYALGAALGCDNLTTDIPVRLFKNVAKPE